MRGRLEIRVRVRSEREARTWLGPRRPAGRGRPMRLNGMDLPG